MKALWCALDADDSNQLTMSEFGGFLKLGDKPQLKKLKSWGSSGTGGKSLSEISAINQTIESTPTTELRKELQSAAVALPEGEELKSLSTRFNTWLEELRFNLGLPVSHSFANLFATVDKDVCSTTAQCLACAHALALSLRVPHDAGIWHNHVRRAHGRREAQAARQCVRALGE